MEDKELLNMWKIYDQKLDKTLALNQQIAFELTKNKLKTTISSLKWPKQLLLYFGIPYTLILCFITWMAFMAEGFIVMFGFGMISLIMVGIIIGYFYHLYLISKINQSDEVLEVQKQIAELKISSFNITRLAVIQLPFWSVCWVSIDELINSPILYGGVNLVIFLGFSYLSFWLYKDLDQENPKSKIQQLIFSGSEWEPIVKSSNILKQLQEYQNEISR